MTNLPVVKCTAVVVRVPAAGNYKRRVAKTVFAESERRWQTTLRIFVVRNSQGLQNTSAQKKEMWLRLAISRSHLFCRAIQLLLLLALCVGLS
jgi:hypothetical protein